MLLDMETVLLGWKFCVGPLPGICSSGERGRRSKFGRCRNLELAFFVNMVRDG
jgi:hypothetical protein